MVGIKAIGVTGEGAASVTPAPAIDVRLIAFPEVKPAAVSRHLLGPTSIPLRHLLLACAKCDALGDPSTDEEAFFQNAARMFRHGNAAQRKHAFATLARLAARGVEDGVRLDAAIFLAECPEAAVREVGVAALGQLVEGKEVSFDVRVGAAKRLAAMRDRRGLQFLAQVMKNPTAARESRVEAAAEVVAYGEAAEKRRGSALLREAMMVHKKSDGTTVFKAGAPTAFKAAACLVEHGDDASRQEAAKALSRLAAGKHDDGILLGAAQKLLKHRIDRETAIRAMLHLMAEGAEEETRYDAAKELLFHGEPAVKREAMKAMAKLAKAGESPLAFDAACRLVEYGDRAFRREGLRELANMATDPEEAPRARLRAARYLAASSFPEAQRDGYAALAPLARSGVKAVRDEALQLLREKKEKEKKDRAAPPPALPPPAKRP